MNQEKDKADLNLFLAESQKDEAEVSAKLMLTKQQIKRKLVDSPIKVVRLYLIGSVLGYLASLAFCEQNTVGIGNFSEKIAMSMCGLGTPWCWLACGVVFSFFPVLVTRLSLNRFEQRYLYRHLWPMVLLTPFAASALMIFLPKVLGAHEATDAMQMMMLSSPQAVVWWLAGAILIPYIVEFTSSFVLKQKRWSV